MGKAGGTFVAIGVMISSFAALNGSILSGSRVPYAQARDGLFPQFLAGVHPRFRTPAAAIAAQSVIAGLLALTGQYQSLFTKVIFSEFLFYALVTAGIFILRRRMPGLARPYRTWGYPFIPAIFVILSVMLLINTLRQQWSDSVWGLALVGSGIPAYFLWRIWTRKVTNSSDLAESDRTSSLTYFRGQHGLAERVRWRPWFDGPDVTPPR